MTKEPIQKAAPGRKTTHGLSRLSAYASWYTMHSRCSDPRHDAWRWYGGRGIAVCERWSSIENFIADMGPRPDGTSIDRIDSNGNYEPGNCRWATRDEQQLNRRHIKCSHSMAQSIRQAYAYGLKQAKIAALYGLSPAKVSQIVRNVSWVRQADGRAHDE
jgi:hypothetical protein